MPQSSSSKKHGSEQPEISGPTPKLQRSKMVKSSEDTDKKVLIFILIYIIKITHYL